MTDAIVLRGVTKTFGPKVAVSDLDLVVPRGSLYGFIGPNGAGKTTTIRMVMSILFPDSGEVEVLGLPSALDAKDRIGYLPEERGLYRKMTVRRVLTYYSALKGMGRREAGKACDEWLERLDLADWGDKKVETLSKGMSQKVQFIATVMTRPELVILDEPFSGLDPVNMEVLRSVILELASGGATVIFSTHDMAKAEEMCDFVCMIFRGRKVLDGTLDEIKGRYGADTIRLRAEGSLDGIEGVDRVRDLGQIKEVRYSGDSQHLLEELLRRGRVEHFELTRPSLHDIFIRIAGPEAGDE